MPLRIVTGEATPPDDPPRLCPRGLRRFSPAAAVAALGTVSQRIQPLRLLLAADENYPQRRQVLG